MALRPDRGQCTCPDWPQRIKDPFFPVWFNPTTGEYILIYGDHAAGGLVIYYCPTCGGKMPESRRGDLFTIPNDAELREVRLLLEKISDITTMRSVLGEPDEVFEWYKDEMGNPLLNPDGPSFIRQHKYSRRWKTLQVSIQEDENGELRFYFYGKPRRPR